jgi:putative two-component system response regulator
MSYTCGTLHTMETTAISIRPPSMPRLPTPTGHTILIVEDDPAIARLAEQLLVNEGHQVQWCANGEVALQQIQSRAPDLILLDLDVPGANGFQVCERIKTNPKTQLIPVVIVTGEVESRVKLRTWKLGADEFLSKPFAAEELIARVRSLLRVKDLVDELDSAQSVVFALARAIDAKCRYTQGHSERVAQHVALLAKALQLSEGDSRILHCGAMLHDIGKIAVPDAILTKNGTLTAEEYAIVKQHPVEGVRIIEPLQSIKDAIPLVRWHHERPDGRGYPDGLGGDRIPILVRVLAVVDVYDALSSERPYRPAMTHEESLSVLSVSADTGGLDAEIVKCFATLPESALQRNGIMKH